MNMMCQEIQYDLPLYSDGVLDTDENASIEEHLGRCPLCREKLDEYKRVQYAVGSVRRAPVPATLLDSIRAAVSLELGSQSSPQFRLVETRQKWIDVWLMPFAVGGLATIVFGISLLWFILNSVSPNIAAENLRYSKTATSPPIFLAGTNPTPGEYANSRMDVSYESPSINPRGSLVELTKVLVSGQISDDEVVVVADVFENGSARITEIVEPSKDRMAVTELERAFHSDLAYAPFVPAQMDQRSDRVRVVFRIQSVSVDAR